jgi:hypothetical protein
MRLRSDFSKYDGGCVTFQNAIALSQGPAFRRPGLKYIATSPGPYPELICDYTSPTISSEPTDTALSSDTDITTRAGFAAITGANHYELMNDLDLTGSWTPIDGFSGVLEGNGYTLSNLTINAPSTGRQGLFASLATGAEIRNLVLDNFSIDGKFSVGALAADANDTNDVTIKNITVKNSHIHANGSNASGTVSACGGIVGYVLTSNNFIAARCTVDNCTLQANQGELGGIIGVMSTGNASLGTYDEGVNRILNCRVSNTTITAHLNNTGGIIGVIAGEDKTTDNNDEIHSCSATDMSFELSTSGCRSLGGLVGGAVHVNFTDCYSTGEITDAGGGGITNAGGFAGSFMDVNAINCYADVDITTDDKIEQMGGFLASMTSNQTEIIHCYSLGDITINNANQARTYGNVGGFIGSAGSDTHVSSYGQITQCWTLGDIYINLGEWPVTNTGVGVGGFIGGPTDPNEYYPDVNNCYTKTDIAVGDNIIAANANFGGFAGLFDAELGDWSITNCYAQGELPADATINGQLGGFIGRDASAHAVVDSNCYWDVEISGVTTDY